MISISYAVTVCDELDEIKTLIPFLLEHKQKQDEIVVLFDESKDDDDVLTYLGHTSGIRVYKDTFTGHFAEWKNKLSDFCKNDYIFQIDADEVPHKLLMENLHSMIEEQPVDLYYVPRVNTVSGITNEHIEKWRWSQNQSGWINFPDYQSRIYKNSKRIKWTSKVHESIVGFRLFTRLPAYEELSLYHHKNIDRQEKQNSYYNTL